MQEFSSVTASSYDADALAPLLSEKSAEGWEVVSIVPAGTNIVAYLARESDGTATIEDAVVEDVAAEVVADDLADDVSAEEVVEEIADDASPTLPGAAAAAVVAEETVAVDEPAGWAAAPESTDDAATESVDDLAAQVAAEEPAAEAASEEVAQEAAAADSAVPAGWYADPSGRFELRYWDGGAWTEHVSRAGQQFTDPPVA